MIIFPSLPAPSDEGSGMLCIPETIELEESEEEVDPFVQALIDCMSKPLRGGSYG